MDRPPRHDSVADRLAQGLECLPAAQARASQAQEVLIEAKERLARAKTTARDIHHPPTHDDPMKRGETP